MENLKKCLICEEEKFNLFLECKDYFLTNETFQILECTNCNFKFVNPRPEKDFIGKYYQSDNYISHAEKKKGLFDFLYSLVKNYTLPKKFILINKYSKGNNILDIGCGTGDFLNLFKIRKWNTFGIEPNDKARSIGNSKFNLNIYSEDQLEKFESNKFDIITLWHVLEHVHDLNERIIEIKRLLKQDGTLFVAVPNPDSYDAKKYNSFWAGYDVPRHLYHFTIKNINDLFAKYSMKIINVKPLKFDSYYISLISEKYQTGENNIFKGMLNGLKSNLYGMKTNNYSSHIYIIKNN